MLVAPAAALHRLFAMQRQLNAARRRGLWLDAPSGGAGGPAAGMPLRPSLLDLDALRHGRPQRFYLPDSAMEQLSDCYAVLEGVRLPLHGQVLAAQAAVLRQLFLGQAEAEGGGASSKERTDLTAAFTGCSLREAACFLRLIYSPDHASPGSLREVHAFEEGLLAAVAGLAHRLDVAGLLAKIEAYLQGAAATATVPELLGAVQLAEACHLAALQDTCLQLLAGQLAAAGPFWHEQVSERQLADCSSDSLAALVSKMAGTVHAGAFEPPVVHAVQEGVKGAAGGFTWVIKHFSKQQGRVTSPWVEVGGVQWRLKVWPKGDDAAGGTHLSAYLECNYAHAQATGLAAVDSFYDFSFLDQSEEGLHYTVDCGKDLFTASTQNWGKTRMMPLEELQRGDRAYLALDRLAVRIAIRVVPPPGGPGTPVGAAGAAAGF